VLHFASPASPIDYLLLPIETMKVGSLGTLHALGLAKEKGARFLLASTSETYGDPQVHPQPESYWGHVNPVGPRGVYDEAKRFAEALTMAYRRTHGVDTSIVRIFNTHGPRMRPNDGRAIPTFASQALTGQPITVAGDGSQTRSVIYVDDLVAGVLALLRSDLAGPVNIGNPHETSVLHLAETIRSLTGSSSEIVFIDRPVDDPTVRQPDIALARAELGWEPRIGFEDGLRRRWTGSARTPSSCAEPPEHAHASERGTRRRVGDRKRAPGPCAPLTSAGFDSAQLRRDRHPQPMQPVSPSRSSCSPAICSSSRACHERDRRAQSALVGLRPEGRASSAVRTSSSDRPTCCAARTKASRRSTLRGKRRCPPEVRVLVSTPSRS
jgi:dTDP-glucose 4,6-dehydratase